MNEDMQEQPQGASQKRGGAWGRSVALVAGGLLAGGIVAGTVSANAASDTGTGTASSSSVSQEAGSGPGGMHGNGDPSKSQRSDEQLLTGDTATKVRDAALAKYPGATIQRVETDSEGVYEAHVVTSDGKQVIVQVGADFSVTGTQSFGGHTK